MVSPSAALSAASINSAQFDTSNVYDPVTASDACLRAAFMALIIAYELRVAPETVSILFVDCSDIICSIIVVPFLVLPAALE